MNGGNGSNIVQWPTDRFYWSVLRVPRSLPLHPRRRQEALAYLFEVELPMPVEQLQVKYFRLAQRTFVACGIEREACLHEALAAATVLQPESWPAFVSLAVADKTLPPTPPLNLLCGDLEGAPVKRLRRRCIVEALLLVAITVALFVTGILRQSGAIFAHAAVLDEQRAEVINTVLGQRQSSGPLPPEQRLIAELRRLERSRNVQRIDVAVLDASDTFSRLLSAWPDKQFHVRTQNVLITPEALTVRGTVENADDAAIFVEQLRGVPGWRAGQPRVDSTRDGVLVTLRYERSGDSQP